MLDLLALTKQLIAQPSLTPNDAECQMILASLLQDLGFTVTMMPQQKVHNLWARYGDKEPLFVFAGHTDVVPAGDLSAWESAPFVPTIRDGYLYGRGVADMKASVAAMITATAQYLANPDFNGSIGFLITSGEEGDDFQHGTPYVMQQLTQQGVKLDYCLVGEPSSSEQLGDTIKIGRRGSLTGNLKIFGKQGHVAYPHLAVNPIHVAAMALAELCNSHWDDGNQFFPPTTFQISNIQAGTGAGNVIPGELNLIFNFRYATASTQQTLQAKVTEILQKHALNYQLDWRSNGLPFLTTHGNLITATSQAITAITNQHTQLSTAGGTSDGRFIAPYGVEVIELGPVNRTIHQVNECVKLSDLQQLAEIYKLILTNIFKLHHADIGEKN